MTRHPFPRSLVGVTRWLTDEEQRAWRGLVLMTSHLNRQLNRDLQDSSGLSLADYGVLVVLSEAPDERLRVYEIARELAWEQSRLSHQLTRMQRRGLVRREECGSDGRGAFAVLTADGRTAIEKAAPTHVESVRRLVFDTLTPEQVATLGDIGSDVLGRVRAADPECRA